MNISFKVFIVVFLIFCVNIISATIINVPGDQPTIQEGINVAVDGDTVIVHTGTYFENINYNGNNITVASLFLTTQDTTYISQTTIDGNQNGSVVTFESGEDSTAVLTGFTIMNGFSNVGGGILCNNSSPSLENLIVTYNSSSMFGGGIYCFNSFLSLKNVTIKINNADWAGGIFCDNSSPSLENVTVISNNANLFGGGICCWNNSSPNLENVMIIGNSADMFGGGIHCEYNSSPSLLNVIITYNSASENGGGIYCLWNSSPTLINCILWNDTPQEVYFDQYGIPNTITISYSDVQDGEAGIVTNNNGTVNWLEGNIDADPLFVGTGEHPYLLLVDSPCIDAGTPDTTGLNLPPWDIIGNLRIWDGDGNGSAIIDMGAYEYGAPPYVGIINDQLPMTSYQLSNYPNPFNPTTTISFNISRKDAKHAEIIIYNIKGQKIKTIVNQKLEQGLHQIIWDGKNDNNQYVASGVYFYKLKVDDKNIAIKKCLLLK